MKSLEKMYRARLSIRYLKCFKITWKNSFSNRNYLKVVSGGQLDIDAFIEGPDQELLYKEQRKEHDRFKFNTTVRIIFLAYEEKTWNHIWLGPKRFGIKWRFDSFVFYTCFNAVSVMVISIRTAFQRNQIAFDTKKTMTFSIILPVLSDWHFLVDYGSYDRSKKIGKAFIFGESFHYNNWFRNKI